MTQVARPLSEFNKYGAIDILKTLQNTSRDNQGDKREFYRLVYQTARGKVNLPKEPFRALVQRLLGDKYHTKVYEAVAKVEKAMSTGRPWSGSSHCGRSSDVPYKRRGMISSAPVPGLGEGGTPLFELCRDVPLDRVCFFLACHPKQGVQFDLTLS